MAEASQASPNFQSRLTQACGIYLRPVETSHQLVESENGGDMLEFYSERDSVRYIGMPAKSDTARIHVELLEKKLPVFSGMYRDDLLLLTVPEGTKPVSGLLTALSRDAASYGDVLFDLGVMMRDMNERVGAMPLPQTSDRAFLDTAAFAFDDRMPHGARLFLVPPYNLDPDLTFEDVRTFVGVDMSASTLFDDSSIDKLLTHFEEGWNAIG